MGVILQISFTPPSPILVYTVFLHSPGWSGAHYVAQSSLNSQSSWDYRLIALCLLSLSLSNKSSWSMCYSYPLLEKELALTTHFLPYYGLTEHLFIGFPGLIHVPEQTNLKRGWDAQMASPICLALCLDPALLLEFREPCVYCMPRTSLGNIERCAKLTRRYHQLQSHSRFASQGISFFPFFCLFWHRGFFFSLLPWLAWKSLCSQGWPVTHSNPPVSAS